MAKIVKNWGLALLLVPAACATPEKPAPVRPISVAPVPHPVITSPGLTGVVGQTAARLQAMFGRPALDIVEGYARKLQFANASCVLDAYLYPPAAGREATVTHVDARLPDGRDYDPATCIAALMQQRQTP